MAFYTFQQGRATDLQEAMRITNAGYVGIGTATPEYDLEVKNTSGNAFIQITAGNTSWSGLYFGDTDLNARGRIYYNHSLESFSFSTSS